MKTCSVTQERGTITVSNDFSLSLHRAGRFLFSKMDDVAESSLFNPQMVGNLCGMFATGCFTIQYIPQALKNYRRKSCEGFSSTGIIIKLVGAAFLMINAYLTGETVSVVAYGLFNVLQHSVFMVQFSSLSLSLSFLIFVYASHRFAIYMKDYKYLLWLLFPFLPLVIGVQLPQSVLFTNMIKPGAQIFSHIPQLYLCYQLKTTQGVSLNTQHLNMVGGTAGIILKFSALFLRFFSFSFRFCFVQFNSLFVALLFRRVR